jgi:hypothetical protein
MSTIDIEAQSNNRPAPTLHMGQLSANMAVIVLWLWLYRGMFDYFSIIFTREDFRTNQLVLLGVIFLIGFQVRNGNFHLRFHTAPQLFRPGLILTLAGSILYLLMERFFNINTLSASLFALTGYGLLGLWMQPHHWRQGCLPLYCSSACCRLATICKPLLAIRYALSLPPLFVMG